MSPIPRSQSPHPKSDLQAWDNPSEEIAPVPTRQSWLTHGLFILGLWLLSRGVMVAALQLAPYVHVPIGSPIKEAFQLVSGYVPKPGWELFTHWDGKWYGLIADHGYSYDPQVPKRFPIVFLPLYSLVSYGVMQFKLPFAIAGTLVNNLAFLATLFVLYSWMMQRYSVKVAQWTTIALVWFPFSFFTSVAYTEGLFLLTTTAALCAFDQRRYGLAAFWGACASATRIFGLALAPTFWLVAWKRKQGILAYLAGFAVPAGLALFMLYCSARFGNGFLLFKSQALWSQATWWAIVKDILFINHQSRVPPWVGFVNGWVRILVFWGGAWLMWRWRHRLGWLMASYGGISWLLLLATNATAGIARYAYGVISFSLAMGMALAQTPKLRIPMLILWLAGIPPLAIGFVWWYFIA